MKFAMAVLLPTLILGVTSAHADNLIVNGSFENGTFYGGIGTSYNAVSAGGTVVTGWVAGTNGFDWHQAVEFYPAYDGRRMVDLTRGSLDGAISQTFSTVEGTDYALSFAVTAPALYFNSATLVVNVGSASKSYLVPRSSESNLSWTVETFNFKADSSSTTLTFSGPSANGYWGPVIDSVSVTAVPEPETYAMMLAGLGFLGVIGRRKTEKVAG